MITAPKFATTYATDQDRALRFWTETMGWELRIDVPDPESGMRWIEVQPPAGGTYLVVALGDGPDDPRLTGPSSVWWDVDDLDATYAELTARGVEFPVPPEEAYWMPGTRWAQMRDSEGCLHGMSEPDPA